MAITTRRHRHPKPPSPAEVALDDQLEAGVDELIGYLVDHCDRWAYDEPPEVLGQLRRSARAPSHSGATEA